MKPLLGLSIATALILFPSFDVQAQQQKQQLTCAQKCKAGCDKNWPGRANCYTYCATHNCK
jgi:hypothetical protein